jgi:hypothetical protein
MKYRESKQSAVKIDEIACQKQLYIAPCFESQDRREEEEEEVKQRVKRIRKNLQETR